MKKILAIAVCAGFTLSVQAASILWTVSGSTSFVMKDYLGNDYKNQSIYLIAGADVSSITYTEDNKLTKDEFVGNLSDLTIQTATTSATGTKPTVSKLEVQSDFMNAGSLFTFGVLMFAEDRDGNGYYRLLTGTGTPFATGADASAQTTFTSAYNTLGGKSWTQAYAVPEPATAALALLGLGLMIKRRKA